LQQDGRRVLYVYGESNMLLALEELNVRIGPSRNFAGRPGRTLTLTASCTGGSGAYRYRWSGGFPGMHNACRDRGRLELLIPAVDRPTWFTVSLKVTDPATGETASDSALITVCP
jgi:hypothetical protein